MHARVKISLIAVGLVGVGFFGGTLLFKSTPAGAASDTASKTFTMSGSVTGLVPGVQKSMAVTVDNPQSQDIKLLFLTAMAIGVNSQYLTFGTTFGQIVPGRKSIVVQLPVTLAADAPDATKGKTWTVKFSGSAQQW